MKRFMPAIITVLFLLQGCSSGGKIDDQMYVKYLTKSYNYSMDKCFSATLAALKESKIGIEKQDRAKGIIITDRVVFKESAQGGQGYATLVSYSHKYYFQISGKGNNSIIKVYKYRTWRNSEEVFEIDYDLRTGTLWNPLFNEIKIKLEEM